MNHHIDQAIQLLLMASKDIKAMDLMITPESIDDEIFWFHAQQAVEKSLKAWIAVIGGRYGFIHDLRVLFLTLREMGCDIKNFIHFILRNIKSSSFLSSRKARTPQRLLRTNGHQLFS
jgi:HEPN domain-containing protein